MSATFSFIPSANYDVQLGRIIQNVITITLDSETFPEHPTLTISDIKYFEIYSNGSDDNQLIYMLDIMIDPENNKKGTATFYSTVDLYAPIGSYAEYIVHYGIDSKKVSYEITDSVTTTTTNPTQYLFTVTRNGPFTDPDNNPNNTATYKLTVTNTDNTPVPMYDIFWSDKIKTGVLGGSNVYTDGTPDPTNPTKKTYKLLSPLNLPLSMNPLGKPTFHTRTDRNGETNLYVTAKDLAIYGVPKYTASSLDANILGTIIIYDPNYPRAFIPEPDLLNPSYIGQYINLDAMPDPLNVMLYTYNYASNTDVISLISNGMLTDSCAYQELDGTSKLLKLPKTTLYTTQSSTPGPFNKLFFVIAANDGTVRTSMYDTFRAIGSNVGPNQPDTSIPRYSPAADLPTILGMYIIKDEISGGVPVYYRFTNQNWVPKAGDILTATYYLNGYRAGTETKRMNKIVRACSKKG